MKMNIFTWIALLLVIIGALNWGLLGIFEFDLVVEIFGAGSTVARVIYTVVGAGGLYLLGYALVKAVPSITGLPGGKEVGQH